MYINDVIAYGKSKSFDISNIVPLQVAIQGFILSGTHSSLSTDCRRHKRTAALKRNIVFLQTFTNNKTPGTPMLSSAYYQNN